MLFFGHIAIAVALADATQSDVEAAVAGNLLPDVTDKFGGWVIRAMPSARWLAHGLPFFSLACFAARQTMPDASFRGFVLGYASHLVADHWAGGRLPWLAPFGKAPREGKRDLNWLLWNLGPELAGFVYLRRRNERRKAPHAGPRQAS